MTGISYMQQQMVACHGAHIAFHQILFDLVTQLQQNKPIFCITTQ